MQDRTLYAQLLGIEDPWRVTDVTLRLDEAQEVGVSFHDLTDIYSKREDALYRDSCCHVNREGYQIVANAIVDALPSEGVWERFKR